MGIFRGLLGAIDRNQEWHTPAWREASKDQLTHAKGSCDHGSRRYRVVHFEDLRCAVSVGPSTMSTQHWSCSSSKQLARRCLTISTADPLADVRRGPSPDQFKVWGADYTPARASPTHPRLNRRFGLHVRLDGTHHKHCLAEFWLCRSYKTELECKSLNNIASERFFYSASLWLSDRYDSIV